MDWGRGSWPYNSAWIWGFAQGETEKKKSALNIGQLFKS